MKNKRKLYTYRLYQNGIMVAKASSEDQQKAINEICHYAFIYYQDGPAIIVPKIPEKELSKPNPMKRR